MGIFKEIPKSDGSGITTFYRISQYRATVEADNDDTTKTMFDYNNALNKPSINNVALVGNKTLEVLGIQPAGDYALKSEIPTKVSQLENDSKYATETFVEKMIEKESHFRREIVDVLPTVGEDTVLYLLHKSGKQGDFYDEYLWISEDMKYEYIGSTSTDLTDYYKKDEVNTLLDKKVDKIPNKGLSTNDYTTDEKNKLASLENYNDADLWNAVNALHNYDDTEVKADIAALESQMEGVNSEIEVLDEKIEYQITLIRLIRHGDEWIWENAKNDILTFQDAFNQLGNPDVLLCLENVESDGKVYPSYYNAEDDYVRVYYLDKEHAIHLLSVSATDATDTILGEDVVYQPKVDSVEKLPAIANKGEVRLVGDDDAVYIYDGNKWVPIDKGTAIDLSNYLPKDNTIAFNPTGNYNPATKKYVDDKVGALFIPTKVSQLTNDSQFIGKNTSDLTNYYVKNKLYTRAEVDALIQSGYTLPVATETTLGGVRVGDNLTIDETGKLSAQAGDSGFEEVELVGTCYIYNTFTEEGTHICLTTGEGRLMVPITTPSKQNTTMEIKAGAIVIYKLQSDEGEDEDGPYFDLHIIANGYPDFYARHERIPTRSTRFVDLNVDGDIYTIPKDTSAVLIKMAKKRVSITQGPATLTQCYIDGSEEMEDLELPGNTMIVCNPTELNTKISHDAMIIFPTGVMYHISTATVGPTWLERITPPAKKYDVLNGGAYLPATGLDIDEVTVPISTDRVVSSGGLVKSFNDDNSITLNGWTGVIKIDVTYLCAMNTVRGGSAQLISTLRTDRLTPRPMQDGPTCITDTAQYQFPLFTYYLENTTGEEVTMHLTVMTTTECDGGMRLYGFAMQQL